MGTEVTLRIRLEIDTDGEMEIFRGDYSNIPEVQAETEEKVRTGEWECYDILIEEDSGGDTWDVVASLGCSVHEAGSCGIYHSPDEIRDADLRPTVQDVWDEAKATIAERRKVAAKRAAGASAREEYERDLAAWMAARPGFEDSGTDYVIEYQHPNGDVWYVASPFELPDPDHTTDLAHAIDVAARLRRGEMVGPRSPKDVAHTRIIQRVSIGRILLAD